MKYDLTYGIAGNQPLPGFFVADTPKRTSRGREDDRLVMLITFPGAIPDSVEHLQQWLSRLAEIFYKSSGSVTSAMRTVVEGINLTLIEKNMKLPEQAERISACFSIGVIHHDVCFIGQSGKSQVVLWGKNSKAIFYDPDLDDHPLGLTQAPKLRFFQQSINEGDVALFSGGFPSNWLTESFSLGDITKSEDLLNVIATRLPLGVSVGLVKITTGEGLSTNLVHSDQSGKADEVVKPSEPKVVQTAGDVDSGKSTEEGDNALILPSLAKHVPEIQDIDPEAAPPALQSDAFSKQDTSGNIETVESVPSPKRKDEESLREKEQTRAAEREAKKAEKERQKQAAFSKVADSASWLNSLGDKLTKFFLKKNVIDGAVIQKMPLSSGTKLLIAFIIPVIVAVLGSVIYIAKGAEDQYQYNMAQARAAADNANLMTTQEQKREAWEQVINWLDKAQQYRDTDEIHALRVMVDQAIDDLDDAIRLVYKPAFSSAQWPTLNVSKLVTIGNDLFLLDQLTGVILHFEAGDNGYTVDLEFDCQPGSYEGITVGPLLDMVVIPISNPAKAPLLAIDKTGNLLFCGIDQNAKAVQLIEPDSGWGQIRDIAFDAGRLFVLDSGNNALWIYRGLTSQFSIPPDSYFSDTAVELASATEIAIGGDELFVLFTDGHISHCLASNVTGLVECQDPYPYQDNREGAEETIVNFEDLKFNQISYSPPPDPSVFLLAPNEAELYQFSLRLNLNRILRGATVSGILPATKVSAFTVSNNRNVYLAFKDQVYYAVIP